MKKRIIIASVLCLLFDSHNVSTTAYQREFVINLALKILCKMNHEINLDDFYFNVDDIAVASLTCHAI